MSSERKPILLLVKTGFVIRNLLLGKFMEHITREVPLVVAVLEPDDSDLKEILAEKNIRLIQFEDLPDVHSLTTWDWYFSMHVFMYRFKQAEMNTEAVHIQTSLFERSRNLKQTILYKTQYALGRLLALTVGINWFEDLYLKSIEKHYLTQRWKKIIEEVQPSLVMTTLLSHCTFRQFSCDMPATVAAKLTGTPTATLVQSWDNMTTKTAIYPQWLEEIWSWSDSMNHYLHECHPRVDMGKVKLVGGAQFDYHKSTDMLESREDFCKEMGLDHSRPIILIGTGTHNIHPFEPETVVQLIKVSHEKHPDWQFLLRIHPKDEPDRWEPYKKFIEVDHVCFQNPSTTRKHMDHGGFHRPEEFYHNQINSVYHSAVILNTASTISVDSAIIGRPVISIGYDMTLDNILIEGRARALNRTTHFKPLIDTGGVQLANDQDHCIALMEEAIADPERHSENRRKIEEMVCGEADGKAGERIAQVALDLIRNG